MKTFQAINVLSDFFALKIQEIYPDQLYIVKNFKRKIQIYNIIAVIAAADWSFYNTYNLTVQETQSKTYKKYTSRK